MNYNFKNVCEDYLLPLVLEDARTVAHREEHIFSQTFERKMEPVLSIRRINHGKIRRMRIYRTIASIAAVWLVIANIPPTEARFKQNHPKNLLSYVDNEYNLSFLDEMYITDIDNIPQLDNWILGWVPEGYTLKPSDHSMPDNMRLYRNASGLVGDAIYFFVTEVGGTHKLGMENFKAEPVLIHGHLGYFFRTINSDLEDSALIWFESETFLEMSISGKITKEEAVKMAESVKQTK